MSLTLYRSPKVCDFIEVCFNLRADEREQVQAYTGQPYDPEILAVQLAAKTGPAWMLCEDEHPIGIAGFDFIRPGVWQDWMVGTDHAWEKHWRAMTRHTKRCMDAILKQDAHRLQCVSLASRIHAHRWYAVIGLAPEGTLKGYGANGEDFIMFARTRETEIQHGSGK